MVEDLAVFHVWCKSSPVQSAELQSAEALLSSHPIGSVKGIHGCSSQPHGIGALFEAAPFHYASRSAIATVERHFIGIYVK